MDNTRRLGGEDLRTHHTDIREYGSTPITANPFLNFHDKLGEWFSFVTALNLW